MKNTILHPTDFSDCANNSLNYALRMAQLLHCKLQIVHSLDLGGTLNMDQNATTMLALTKKMEKEAEIKIQQLGDICKKAGVHCEASIFTGKINSWLPKYISENNPMLVVMGTTGAGGIPNKIFGSNTYSIIKDSHSPVLAIPINTKIKTFSHLILSTNYKDKDIEAIQFLSKLAKPSNALIDVVHILDQESAKKVNNQILLDNLNAKVQAVEKYENISYSLQHGENTEECLQVLIAEKKPELLTLIMRKQNFFERLFFGSLTDKLVHHTNIPLLIFPDE